MRRMVCSKGPMTSDLSHRSIASSFEVPHWFTARSRKRGCSVRLEQSGLIRID